MAIHVHNNISSEVPVVLHMNLDVSTAVSDRIARCVKLDTEE
jgi:hypothetical protein